MESSGEGQNRRLISTADDNLAVAIEAVYDVFSKYQKPPLELCIDWLGGPIPDRHRAAWEKTLRQYTDAELLKFSTHSLCLIKGCYDGWHADFVQYLKFWLPRFLQGLADVPGEDWNLIEHLLSARWREWPAHETEAVRRWCEAWLAACLVRPAKLIDAIMGDHRAADSLSFAIEIGADVIAVLYSALRVPSLRALIAVKGIFETFAPTLI